MEHGQKILETYFCGGIDLFYGFTDFRSNACIRRSVHIHDMQRGILTISGYQCHGILSLHKAVKA
jgi:hypothetical protein